MAKSPRKGYSTGKQAKDKVKITTTTKNNHTTGGKQFNNPNYDIYKQRRFSILSSSLSEIESDAEKTFQYQPRAEKTFQYQPKVQSELSDSSLTEVSDIQERRSGSKTVGTKQANKSHRIAKKTNSKTHATKTLSNGPANSNYARKRTPKMDWDAESDDSEDDFGEGIVDGTGIAAFGELYAQESSSDSDSDSDTSKKSRHDSSSDDSDVDFLKLQAEQKANTIKAARAMKGISKFQRNELARQQFERGNEQRENELARQQFEREHSFNEVRQLRAQNSDEDSDLVLESDSDLEVAPMRKVKTGTTVVLRSRSNSRQRSRSNSVLRPYGRRKSEAVLPEDINFTFEFGEDQNTTVATTTTNNAPEEDIGEEVKTTGSFNFDFDFDLQLIQVPKFKDDELNSDEDYEIDDDALLATLQEDNDHGEFLDTQNNSHRNSLSSIGDEDEFLKEEERFLVNEFESNGFDEDDANNSLLDSFNNMNEESQVIQYESSVDDSGDEDDYEDFIDFNVPLFEDGEEDEETSLQDIPGRANYVQTSTRKKKKKTKGRNSDEDDDSYLWNYFFSSDESEGSEIDPEHERVYVEELFKELEQPNNKPSRQLLQQQQEYQIARKMTISKRKEEPIEELDYDSGESTDVDLDLPVSSKNNGSNLAKEVLSSKTADYRPPVLGTWVAVDSKPFGIIDGLSTRSLGQQSLKNAEPRSKSKKSISIPMYSSTSTSPLHGGFLVDDAALGLDELLNVSELDNDDENDIKIWRDFNIQQQKKVPLGAFRNKSIMNPSNVPHFYQQGKVSNNEYSKRRYSLTNAQAYGTDVQKPAIKNGRKQSITRRVSYSATPTAHAELAASGSPTSKQLKRRRASIVEAVAEGYRPTKSGLFSEHALTNVEEFLGDDNDLMALIKGL